MKKTWGAKTFGMVGGQLSLKVRKCFNGRKRNQQYIYGVARQALKMDKRQEKYTANTRGLGGSEVGSFVDSEQNKTVKVRLT
jgi:hypothetical protein